MASTPESNSNYSRRFVASPHSAGEGRSVMARQTENYFLCFNECPKHSYKSVSVDLIRADGSGHGTRVTPSKCCGSWSTVRKWMLSASEWKVLADEARRAQRLAARREKGGKET